MQFMFLLSSGWLNKQNELKEHIAQITHENRKHKYLPVHLFYFLLLWFCNSIWKRKWTASTIIKWTNGNRWKRTEKGVARIMWMNLNVNATNIRIISNQVDSIMAFAAQQMKKKQKRIIQNEFIHLNWMRQVVDSSILSTADRAFWYPNQLRFSLLLWFDLYAVAFFVCFYLTNRPKWDELTKIDVYEKMSAAAITINTYFFWKLCKPQNILNGFFCNFIKFSVSLIWFCSVFFLFPFISLCMWLDADARVER